MEVLRIVFTPGIPSKAEDRGYVIWSSISRGERPIHSVAIICWLSPMSGIASTGTGLRGKKLIFQLKGADMVPHPMKTRNNNMVISLFSRKYFMSRLNMKKELNRVRNYLLKTDPVGMKGDNYLALS